jgi:hypothetical protein
VKILYYCFLNNLWGVVCRATVGIDKNSPLFRKILCNACLDGSDNMTYCSGIVKAWNAYKYISISDFGEPFLNFFPENYANRRPLKSEDTG